MATGPTVIEASYLDGDRYALAVRGHTVFTDQPVEDGGRDTAPTPTELFVAGLAGCIAYYAGRFLRRHQLPADGLKVTCSYTWAENPHRVGDIELWVEAPGLPYERREAFSRVIEHCAVHNTLQQPPRVSIRLAPVGTAAA